MPTFTAIDTPTPAWGCERHPTESRDESGITVGWASDEVDDSVTGVALIGYEDHDFAHGFIACKRKEAHVRMVVRGVPVNPTCRLRAAGLAHNLSGPTSVSAVTILEGPGSGG